MTRHRWAWAALATFAGSALGADPASEIRAPKEQTGKDPVVVAEPADDVIVPIGAGTWPRRPIVPHRVAG